MAEGILRHYLQLILLSIVTNCVYMQSHNEPCPCDADTPLQCVGGFCRCIGEPQNSYWDSAAQTCFLFAGTSCVTNPSLDEARCIPKAQCHTQNGNPVCVCHQGLQVNDNKMCHLDHGDKCSTQHDLCDPIPFLKCSLENKCDCDTHAIYDQLRKTCVLLPGSFCSLLSPACIDGTTCDVADSTCKCDAPSSEPNVDNPSQCVLSHGDHCDYVTNPFSICYPAHLDCVGGICACQGQGTTSSYNNLTKSCLQWADENCDPGGMSCVPGAICNDLNGSIKCRCKPPLSSSNHQCYLQIGQNCTQQNDLCDPYKFLSCDYDGRCSCGNNATYIDNEEVCDVLPGSACLNSSDTPQCIEGTQCGLNLTCDCDNPSALPSKDDPTKCYLPYGEECGSSMEECDPYSHLVCQGDNCICDGEPIMSIYNNRTKQCQRLANEPCVTEPDGMRCIATAICKMTESQYSCHCRFPMSRGSDGFCYLQHEQNCTQQNDLCDPGKFLVCDLEGKCSCGSEAVYTEMESICKLLPGSPCPDSPNTQECIDGTQCGLNSTCECSNPFALPSADDITKCYLPYEAECEAGQECDPYSHLECQAGICRCKGEPFTSIYNSDVAECQSLAGEICLPDGMRCIPTASCKMADSQYSCQCKFPMSRGSQGFCYLQTEQNCTQRNDLCDPGKFLSCDYEGKCTCGMDAVYVFAENICKSLPGSKCNDSYENRQCIDGTSCRTKQQGMQATCECINAWSVPSKEDRTKCFLPYGEMCGPRQPECDPYSHLSCKAEVCLCEGEPEKSRYDNKTRQCQRLAEEFCLPEPVGMSCISTASCKMTESKYSCQCRYPLSRGSDGLCCLQHKQNCSRTNDLCNPNKFLECDLEGRCSCGVGAIYDEDKQTCLLLPGADCTISFDGLVCIEGTKCILDPMTRKRRCVCSGELSYPSIHDPTKCFVSHGVKCIDPQMQCDPYSHLVCEEGVCNCQQEFSTSTYDNRTESCLRLADEECLPEPGGMGCIRTAVCKKHDSRYKCQCRPPMSRGSDGFCYLKHGQNCSRDNDLCDINQFLSCNYDAKCSCGSDAIYDTYLGTCVILPERECIMVQRSQTCVNSTECQLINTVTGSRICQCPGISRASGQDPTRCILDHNQPCANSAIQGDDLCDPFQYLECSETLHCRCKGGFSTWFDKETTNCYLKARQSCISLDQNPFAQKCTPNSHCFYHEGTSICVCNDGFVPNRNGQCFLPHLSKCSLKNDLCDPSSFLKCDLENDCSCGVDAIYSELTSTCELLSNSTCSPMETYPERQPCIPNAMCRSSSRKCECIHEFEENKDRKCFLQYKTPCEKTRDLCDPKSMLQCGRTSGSCICQGEDNGYGWRTRSLKKCFRLAGSLCGRQDESECIPNASCDPVDKKCLCNETLNLTPNSYGFCFVPYGRKCNTRNDLCDPAAFLECHQDNPASETICRCQREYETFFDPQSLSCRLISDRPCNPGSDLIVYPEEGQLCDRNALCLANAPGNFTYRCRCNDKFFPNPEKICYLPYKSNCVSDTTECDPYGNLQCRRRNKGEKADIRHCLCATDKMYYDEEIKQCLSFPGELCDNSPTSQKCRKNAQCGKDLVCECKPGYEATPDGQCLLRYGEICEGVSKTECHYHANLACRGGYCLCLEGYIEHHFYDGKSNKTVCFPGYEMNCENKLWLHFSQLKCSPDAFLTCNSTVDGGICACQNPAQVFIGTERQCKSTRNMPCDNYELLCIPGADCIQADNNSALLKCECAENYTVNWMDPRFCISGGRAVLSIKQLFMLLCVLLSFA